MVGVLVVQFIGEFVIQMMLNIFYFVGVLFKNVIFGVLCFKEIFNLVSNIKILSMKVYFDKLLVKQEDVKKLCSFVEYINLCFVIFVMEIFYDFDLENMIIVEDVDMVEFYFFIFDDFMDIISQ